VVVEADAYFLPDTSATTYHTEHSKTSVAIESLDVSAQRIGYFHAAGYHGLSGDDFRGLFRLQDTGCETTSLAPYAEIVKLDGVCDRTPADLLARSLRLLQIHVERRGTANPVRRFQQRVDEDIRWLGSQDLDTYHRYAFATLRQLGGSQELAALYLRWLAAQGHDGLDGAWTALESVSDRARQLQLKMARVVNGRKVADLNPILDLMADDWDCATRVLAAQYATTDSAVSRT
jgi:hypothetical protein